MKVYDKNSNILLISFMLTVLLVCTVTPSCLSVASKYWFKTNEMSGETFNEIKAIQGRTAVTFSVIFSAYPELTRSCNVVANSAIKHLSNQETYFEDAKYFWGGLLENMDDMDDEYKQSVIDLFNDIRHPMEFYEDRPITRPTLDYVIAFFEGVILAVDAQIDLDPQPEFKKI
jgi:hypothetical protein